MKVYNWELVGVTKDDTEFDGHVFQAPDEEEAKNYMLGLANMTDENEFPRYTLQKHGYAYSYAGSVAEWREAVKEGLYKHTPTDYADTRDNWISSYTREELAARGLTAEEAFEADEGVTLILV